jgi:hypothetical protein
VFSVFSVVKKEKNFKSGMPRLLPILNDINQPRFPAPLIGPET